VLAGRAGRPRRRHGAGGQRARHPRRASPVHRGEPRAVPDGRGARRGPRGVSGVSTAGGLAGAGARGEKRAAFRDQEYWGRPVPASGPPTPGC
jgi:hypothetical protein